MTSRERVLKALNHNQPDIVPFDIGSTGNTSISKVAYERLKMKLGITKETRIFSRDLQLAEMDEEVLDYLGTDTRGVWTGSPKEWRDIELDENSYIDEWGVVRKKSAGSLYYDVVKSPFEDGITLEAIENFKWPDPADRGRIDGIREKAKFYHENTGCAVVLHVRGGFITQVWYLRGFENFLTDLVLQPERIGDLLDRTLDFQIKLAEAALKEAAPYVDVVHVGDDLGVQDGLMFSPKVYREILKPRQAKLFQLLKSYGHKLMLHTCGSVYEIIEDLIEIGVDALNPIQVSAKFMEPTKLKQQYGDKISFWGGIDTQRVLPYGSIEDVRNEVKKMISILASGGGYILGAVHNVQADVPPENILEMARACKEYGASG